MAHPPRQKVGRAGAQCPSRRRGVVDGDVAGTTPRATTVRPVSRREAPGPAGKYAIAYNTSVTKV